MLGCSWAKLIAHTAHSMLQCATAAGPDRQHASVINDGKACCSMWLQHLWRRGYMLGCIDVGGPVCAWSLGLLHQDLCCWRVLLQQHFACQVDCPSAGFRSLSQ